MQVSETSREVCEIIPYGKPNEYHYQCMHSRCLCLTYMDDRIVGASIQGPFYGVFIIIEVVTISEMPKRTNISIGRPGSCSVQLG